MSRLFCEHRKREVTSLDGAWRAVCDRECVGETLGFENGIVGGQTVIVPSVWNTEPQMLEYEGVVWYEKELYTPGGVLRFSFGSVMTHAKVYLDGELLGEHYGGFCKFSFTKTGVSEGIHRLIVRVDNRFDRLSIPHALVDWYHYGGITRSVTVERLFGISVLYSFLDYTLEDGGARCRARCELYNAEDRAVSDTVRIYIDGAAVAEGEASLEAFEKKTVDLEFTLSDVNLWSCETPRLYGMLCETASDDLFERVGFRKIEVLGRKILLNGEELIIRGVNRHEEHPDFGMAFPLALMPRDVGIIKNMGCNAIRGSHYPNDPAFLDMLDEEGLLFWSEVPMWGPQYDGELFSSPPFCKRAMDMHREMVREYYNHPSIVIWGIFNETDTSAEATKGFAEGCYSLLKKEGGGRLVTYATNKPCDDICLSYCDFISLNVYVGWYEYDDEGFGSWETALDTIDKRFEQIGVSDKPIVMSEFGAAAIYGHHTFDDLKWTEEYQARLLEDCLELFFSREGYVGAYVWQYCDIRTSKEMGLNRARSYNNKGLLNEYRRPKLAYGAVRDFYLRLKKIRK